MLDLLKQLIAAAPTANNGESKAAQALADFFNAHGIKTELDTWDDRHANVVAHLKSGHCTAPLLLAAHIDVVPADAEQWTTPPFAASEKDGKLYGRGATDMLGAIAAAAAAMAQAAANPQTLPCDIILAALAGEETDSCGAKRFVRQYRQRFADPIGVIVPEPTALKPLRAHRGLLWLRITAHGRTAHGSMPHLGVNAILKINALLNRLGGVTIPHTPHPLLGSCSLSANRIAGGSGVNIVPDVCTLDIDIRTLPGQSTEMIIGWMQNILNELAEKDQAFKADIAILRQCDAMETPAEEPFVRAVCQAVGQTEAGAVGFTTDAPFFAPLGPVVIFGPGDPQQCHKPDEWIAIDALHRAKDAYAKIFRSLGCIAVNG